MTISVHILRNPQGVILVNFKNCIPGATGEHQSLFWLMQRIHIPEMFNK
jgi:hypothetical protein